MKTVIPLYVRSAATWSILIPARLRPIRVIGFDARTKAFSDHQLLNPLLRQLGTALFDIGARCLWPDGPGTIVPIGGRQRPARRPVFLGQRPARRTATCSWTKVPTSPSLASTTALPRSISGSSSWRQAATPRRPWPRSANMGEGVRVLPRNDFAASVKNYWQEYTPTGFLFQVGVVVGLIIGVIVCYQILFTEISANLMPFATLKGMGYRNQLPDQDRPATSRLPGYHGLSLRGCCCPAALSFPRMGNGIGDALAGVPGREHSDPDAGNVPDGWRDGGRAR